MKKSFGYCLRDDRINGGILMNVSEKDWKLLRKYLPEWQETYMEKLVVECSNIT